MESYYSRFYKLMNELTMNNLQVTTMQVNVQFLQQLQPEWSRFVTVVKKSKEIDTLSYHTLFDILKQYPNEVNDIRAERIAKSANPLALLRCCSTHTQLNYYQGTKTREQIQQHLPQDKCIYQTPWQRDGKSEASTKPSTKQQPSNFFKLQEQELKNHTRSKQRQSVRAANGYSALTARDLSTSAKECRKPKRGFKDYTYHKEKMMMCKQAEQGVPLQAEQADWLADTDEEIDEQELEAHYSFMAKIQEVLPEESSSTEQPLEQDDSNVTPDSSNICNNDNQVDQNATECDDEHATLANLIANLTLDTEENKTIFTSNYKKQTHH
ncbi:hypothetical protein Tco_1295048 [Tanacetum coccineum]